MRTRRIATLAVFACLTAAAGLLPSAAFAGPGNKDQNTASETYYRLDVPNGVISARVDAKVQNGGSKDMTAVVLWAMPRAENVSVRAGDTPLEFKVTPASSVLPVMLQVTLPKTLKSKAQMDLVVEYQVPPQSSANQQIEPGAMEITLVSQGPGSFVFTDVPAAGDNFFDPGCVKVANQPKDVSSAGLERWMCGEVSAAAFYSDVTSVQKQCAELDDRCRQRANTTPWSAAAQSVTDKSKQGLLEADVTLSTRVIHLEFRYFKRDDAWARAQFEVAKAALPVLEAAFNQPYYFEKLKIRQSHHIGDYGAAGLAFFSGGDVLITPVGGASAEVTVHELAHQWAGGGGNMAASWLSEGLAEYGMRVVAPGVGVAPSDTGWASRGSGGLGLFESSWAIGDTDPAYWYGKAGAFWFAYEAAIGGRENMLAVLGRVDDAKQQWPLDGQWFMDRGEEVSGANLDSLFLSWVWDAPASGGLIKTRRDAQTLAGAVRARAAEFGFTGLPTDLQANLDAWTFAGVTIQVNQANAMLDDYAKLAAEVEAAGLPQIDPVKKAWNTVDIKGVSTVITDQRQALEAIVNSTIVLKDETADAPSVKQLAEARQKWAEGNLDEATRLGAQAATTSFNEDASVKMIALAKEKQEGFKGSFLGRIGLMFTDPDAKLDEAEAALAAGDPTRAMDLAEDAYSTWDNANRNGLIRLAVLMGAMCLLSAAVWWLLRRLDLGDDRLRIERDPYTTPGSHSIGDPESRRPSWRDWENS